MVDMINQEAVDTVSPFSGPVPGQSLTNSPDSQQPWEQAPEYTSLRKATQEIFLNLLEDEMLETVVTLMANGTPIGDITKMLLVSGMSKGKFNVDLMLSLIEPVMYMLLAIAEKVGIKNVKLNREDDEGEPEELDVDETRMLTEQARKNKNQIRNPKRFADLRVNNLGANQIDQELINKLENLDVSKLQESLMGRSEQVEQGTEGLMARPLQGD